MYGELHSCRIFSSVTICFLMAGFTSRWIIFLAITLPVGLWRTQWTTPARTQRRHFEVVQKAKQSARSPPFPAPSSESFSNSSSPFGSPICFFLSKKSCSLIFCSSSTSEMDTPDSCRETSAWGCCRWGWRRGWWWGWRWVWCCCWDTAGALSGLQKEELVHSKLCDLSYVQLTRWAS